MRNEIKGLYDEIIIRKALSCTGKINVTFLLLLRNQANVKCVDINTVEVIL